MDVVLNALVRVIPFDDIPLRCGGAVGRDRLLSRDQLKSWSVAFNVRQKGDCSYILTALSSPADANIPGFVGFHDIEFTHPEICPSRVSTRLPFSLCQM